MHHETTRHPGAITADDERGPRPIASPLGQSFAGGAAESRTRAVRNTAAVAIAITRSVPIAVTQPGTDRPTVSDPIAVPVSTSTAPAPMRLPARPLPVGRLRLTERIRAKALVLGGLLIVLPAFFIKSNSDPDYWWHLRDGQWIVQHLTLPAHDLYTYTAVSHVWTDHEYLSEAAMWVTYSWGGTSLVSIVFGAVALAGFVLIGLSAQALRRPYLVVALFLLLAAFAGTPIWSPRVQMLTFFFACLELYWLRRLLAGRSRAIYMLPLVMVLWANLHGGWAVAFVFLAVALLAEGVEWWLDRSPEQLARLKRLAAVTVVTAAAVGATPHGLSLYAYPFQTQGSAAQQDLIIEWLSPNFHEFAWRPFEAMVLLLVLGFAIRRPRPFDLLLAVAALAMALQSVRHIAIYVAATTPILIATWSDIWFRFRDRTPWRPKALPASAFITTITIVLLLGTVAGVGQHIAADLQSQPQVSAASFPVAATDWMATHPDELGSRMYNQYGWGGYLAYRFYPDSNRRVFIFGEAELMGDALMYDYQRVQSVSPQWSSVLKRYRVDTVIFNTGAPLDVLLRESSSWKQVYRDPVAVIYVRK